MYTFRRTEKIMDAPHCMLLYKYAQRALHGDLARAAKLKHGWVRFTYAGSFTIAMIIDMKGRVYGVGAAKHMAKDKYNPQVGEAISLWRAFDDYFYGLRSSR